MMDKNRGMNRDRNINTGADINTDMNTDIMINLSAPETGDPLKSSDSSIRIENNDSRIRRFFQIDVPFQITLEYCSGSDPDDYVNIVTLSAQKSIFYQQTLLEKNWFKINSVPHFHDFYEFLIVLEGSLIQQIEGKDYLYNAGACCLINRGLCHLEHYTTKCKVLFIGLAPSFMEELLDSAHASLFQNERLIYDSPICHFIHDDRKHAGKKAYLDFIPAYQNNQHAAQMHRMTESIFAKLMCPSFGASYQIKGEICALLDYLSSARNYHCTNICIDSSSDFLIFSRITRLFEESSGRMSRADLERLLNYSGGYLNRIVNKYTGMCLYDYGMDFCLKKAAKYLTESNDSISSIAAKLQFSNRTHFYRLFKEKYGVTPKEYRRAAALSPDSILPPYPQNIKTRI